MYSLSLAHCSLYAYKIIRFLKCAIVYFQSTLYYFSNTVFFDVHLTYTTQSFDCDIFTIIKYSKYTWLVIVFILLIE